MEPGVHREGFRGIGIVLVHGGVNIGWIDLEQVEVDMSRSEGGHANVGGWEVYWGRQAEELAQSLGTTSLGETGGEKQ